MSISKFIERLLKIKGFRVKNFKFKNWFRELWLEVDPAQHSALSSALQALPTDDIGASALQITRVVGDAQDRLRSFQAELIVRTATTAFMLNALTLVLLSSASFLLI